MRKQASIGLWIIVIVLASYLSYAAPPTALAQQFDAAATVTALVQTREAIILTLTGTPPAPGSAGTPEPGAPSTVTIKVQGLNVRSGPGTNYGVVSSVNAGQSLTVIGKTDNCGWIHVQDGARELGWISGSTQYVTYTTPCADLP